MNKNKIVVSIILFVTVVILGTLSFAPFIIQLNGEKEMTVRYGEEYEEAGASGLYGIGEVIIEGEVNTSKLGDYKISYRYIGAKKVRIVHVADESRPVITLNGYREVTLPLNGTYEDLGYSATDDYDGDITDKVIVTSELDTSIEGEYTITYEVEDSSGNKTREKRLITVTKNNPMTAPLNEYDISPYFPNTILQYTDKDTGENLKNLVFFGDSILGNLGFYGYIDTGSHFWSRSSMTPENLEYRIINVACQEGGTFYDELAKRKPSDILILIGTETMVSSSAAYLAQCYEEAMQKMLEVSPETHYIIMSVLPLTKAYETANDSRNTEINKANYLLCQLCEKYGMHFMNAAEALKDETGVGDSSMYSSDNIHPSSGKGSSALYEYICTHLSY